MAQSSSPAKTRLAQVQALLAMLSSNPLATLSFVLPLVATAFLLLSPATIALQEADSKSLVLPAPTHCESGDTVLCLSPNFEISFDGSSLGPGTAPKDLLDAAKRTVQHIRDSRHAFLSPTRGEEFFSAYGAVKCDHYLDSLVLSTSTSGYSGNKTLPSIFSEATRPAEDRPALEAYRLSVPVSGPARLRAKSSLGLFRGLTTFEQLFYHMPISRPAGEGPSTVLSRPDSLSGSQQLPLGSQQGTGSQQGRETAQEGQTPASGTESGAQYAPYAPYEIEDKPSFPWRAVLLDTSRNWFGVPAILKMLDTMALVKLSVFHWHITDSNSWPMELAALPELAANAAYSASQTYSEADIKHIIQYAGERGIDVLIEIDTPGHTATIALTRPDLIACYDVRPWKSYAHQPPPGQLRFTDPAAAEYTSQIFQATMGLTSSPYFGTGGDEINEACMLEDDLFAHALQANGWTLDDALNDFTGRTHATIRAQGRTPVVWQEMVLIHGPMPSIGPDTIVEVWISSADNRKVLDKGYKIVHAAADYFYLDCGQGGWMGEEGGGNSWCDPFKTWARMYSFNPYADVTDEQKKLVMGGQALLWAEQTDETNFEGVLWPRAAAVAELFWTGAGKGEYPRSTVEALPRMNDVRYRMVDRGVRAVPLQPHWCALRPHACDMTG